MTETQKRAQIWRIISIYVLLQQRGNIQTVTKKKVFLFHSRIRRAIVSESSLNSIRNFTPFYFCQKVEIDQCLLPQNVQTHRINGWIIWSKNRIEYKVYVRKEYIQPHTPLNTTVAIFERTQKERKRKFCTLFTE